MNISESLDGGVGGGWNIPELPMTKGINSK